MRPGATSPGSLLAILIIAFITASCSRLPVIAPRPEGLLTADEHLKLASIYISSNEDGAAVKQIKMAVEAGPESASIRFRAGNLYLGLKRFKEAEDEYGEAVRLDPVNAAYRNNLAWARMEAGRFVDAESSAREAMKLDPAGGAAYLDTLGVILVKKGDLNGAEAAFLDAANAAVASGGKGAAGLREIYGHLIELYRGQGRADKAVEAEEKLKGLE